MSIAFVLLGWILLLITPSAVKLSVWIRVQGCGWPILVCICRRYTASCAFWYSAPNSALAADVITAFIIVAIVRMALFLEGYFLSLVKKKCSPARLRDFFSLQYPALLWTPSIILLAEYDMIASSCNAQ